MDNNITLQKKVICIVAIALCFVALIAALVMIVLQWDNEFPNPGGDDGTTVSPDGGGETDEGGMPTLVIETVSEEGADMIVTTSYGRFVYPVAFSDLIKLKATEIDGGWALEFTALIDGKEYALYTLGFGDPRIGSNPVGSIILGEDNTAYDVWVVFGELDPLLDSVYHTTFYATLETFNDVVFSFEENENFTIAD